MAFVQTAIWEVRTEGGARPAPDRPILTLIDRLLANGGDFYASRALSAMLAVLIQIVIIWLFLLSQARPVRGLPSPHTGAITLIDLSKPVDAEPTGASAPQQQLAAIPVQPPTTAPQSLVDPSSSPIARPEWSVSKIVVSGVSPAPLTPSTLTPALASAANGTASGTGSNGNQNGTGIGGGGSGYDPNAGAAPLRRNDLSNAGYAQAAPSTPTIGERIMGFLGLSTPTPTPAPERFDLDRSALEAARTDAAGRVKGARGSVTFAVRISPTGMVLDAVVKKTSLSRQAAMAVRAAILGRRLYLPRGALSDGATIELPAMVVG